MITDFLSWENEHKMKVQPKMLIIFKVQTGDCKRKVKQEIRLKLKQIINKLVVMVNVRISFKYKCMEGEKVLEAKSFPCPGMKCCRTRS